MKKTEDRNKKSTLNESRLPTLQEQEEEKKIFLKNCLQTGEKLLQNIFHEKDPHGYTTEQIDTLIKKWVNKELEGVHIPQHAFINIAGTLLGEYVNQEFNGYWALTTAVYGTDYSCKISTEKFEFEFFPFSIVQHIIQDPSKGTLSGLINTLRKKLT